MPVNDAFTDSVSQVNTANLGSAPAMGQGNLQVVSSHALSDAAHNAEANCQQSVMVTHTTTVQNLNALFSQGAIASKRIMSTISSE